MVHIHTHPHRLGMGDDAGGGASTSAARQQRVAVVGGTALGGLLDQGASVEEAVRCVRTAFSCLFVCLFVLLLLLRSLYTWRYYNAPHKTNDDTTPHHTTINCSPFFFK